MTRFIPSDALSCFLSVRGRTVAMLLLLVAANGFVWLWVWVVFEGRPALLGAAMLAYGLGLRHAVDADHIAAIDNATRKMMEAGRYPVTLGMFFSLGHSAIVFALTLAVVVTTATLTSLMDPVRVLASVVGTVLSATFLLAVAAANLMILIALGRALLHAGITGEHAGHFHAPALKGVMSRLLAPLLRSVTRSWHMFFVGFLFGLGFETASEISLLGLSASEMSKGLSPWSILVFPALFAAGMSLLDAADGALMVGVYGWALSRPDRRLVYNLIVTGLSVVVALLIAGAEISGLIGGGDDRAGGGASLFGLIDLDMNRLGFVVVFFFASAWLIAVVANRLSLTPMAGPFRLLPRFIRARK